MPGKLRFQWTGPFWVTREFNGSYQIGALVGELLSKWGNGFRLKLYKGRMPNNPFKEPKDPRSTEGKAATGDSTATTESVVSGTTDT